MSSSTHLLYFKLETAQAYARKTTPIIHWIISLEQTSKVASVFADGFEILHSFWSLKCHSS